MADIEITRAHHMTLKAARAAADEMAGQLGKKFGLAGGWEGNTLKFERPGVSGSLGITEKDVNISVSLGFLLKAMKGSIEQAVRHELDKLFAHKAAPTAAEKSEKPAAPKAKKAAPPPKKSR